MSAIITSSRSNSKNYTETEWRDDLKDLLVKAGAGKKHVTFLFADTQVKYPSFVEDVNSMLNTGTVPNLFAMDERVAAMDECRTACKDEPGVKQMGSAELWAYFISRCRDRLHIVLAFSPIGSTFRERLRKFPSLKNCCTIDWFFSWPKDALTSVARKFLGDVEMDASVKESVVASCGFIHESVRGLSERFKRELKRINYVTPTSYLELILSFKDKLKACRKKVEKQISRYSTGLEKLSFAEDQVSTMQKELTDLLPTLEVAKKDTDALMGKINEKLPGVQAMSETVGAEAATVQEEADRVSGVKKECEDDLAEAMPILNDAIKALNTLKPSDITEVKNFKTPLAVLCSLWKLFAY